MLLARAAEPRQVLNHFQRAWNLITKHRLSGNLRALSRYVKERAPDDYLDDNPDYYECLMPGANILLAIMAIMFMGEGFSMAGQPWQHLNRARVSAAKIFAIINRVPAIDSFSDAGAKRKSSGNRRAPRIARRRSGIGVWRGRAASRASKSTAADDAGQPTILACHKHNPA